MADYSVVPDIERSVQFARYYADEWQTELEQIHTALKRIQDGQRQATDREVWLLASRLALHSQMLPGAPGSQAEYDIREQMQ
jgi:hypothetical protein